MNLVFFDIDGTLLPEGSKEISSDVRDAIIELKNTGAEVFICTGRCYHQAKFLIDELELDSYITSNGQEVCYKGEIIYHSFYSKEQKKIVLDLAESSGVTWGFETRSNINLPSTKDGEYVKSVLEGYGFVDVEFSDNHDQEIFQFWFFGHGEKVANAISKLDSQFSHYMWNSESVEILPGVENKGNGIAKVLDVVGSDAVTYGFGDGVNDLEMLDLVDFSVAMGNASDDVKSHASFITKDCTAGGIRHGLEMVKLLKKG